MTQPERELRRLSDFLGETFDPAMLEAHRRKNKGFAEREVHKLRTLEPVTDTRIARYRGVLTRRELAGFQAVAGRQLRSLGYELEPVPAWLGWWAVAAEFPAILMSRLRFRKRLKTRPEAVDGRVARPPQ